MPLRVAFATLGCKVNRADTSLIQEVLPDEVDVVHFQERADVYVINTCTVTATADRQSRQLVRRAHRANPAAAIIVTGCLADRDPAEVRDLEGVVRVAPNSAKPALAAELARRAGLPRELADSAEPVYRPAAVTRPPLKIQDGCDGACAYCAVAPARGSPRSTPPGEVLRRLESLGSQGCPEVVLAGIDLGAWGLDLSPPDSLASLLALVGSRRPVKRVRLSSIEVLHLDDLLLRVVADSPWICRHLHLPLQSGSDRVLCRMRRRYSAHGYATRLEAARRTLPGVIIGADVIAGFPGETAADHARTMELVADLEISYLHVFPFSPRPSTPAATFSDQLPAEEVRERARRLRRLGDQLWRKCRLGLVGRETTAVVSTRRSGAGLEAFSHQGVSLTLAGDDSLMGKLVRVRLGELTEGGMEAEVLASPPEEGDRANTGSPGLPDPLEVGSIHG